MSICSPITFGVRVLALSLVLGAFWFFNTGSTLAAKNRGAATANAQTGNSQVTGQLIATGSVTVNGNKAITGTTVFTDSNIIVDCAKGNSAIINLGKLGRIELVPGTKLTLRFSDGLIAGNLQDGKAVISTPGGVKVAVDTPTGVVSANCQQACVTPVVVQGFVQCVPVVAAPPVYVAPVGGLSRAAIAGVLLGVGGVTAATVATEGEEEIIPLPVVSPTTP